MPRRRGLMLALLVTAVGAVACSSGCATDIAGNYPVGADDFPPLTGKLQEVSGTVFNPGNGCFALADELGAMTWIVWPAGSARSDGVEDGIRLPNGDVVNTGDTVLLHGQPATRTALPGGENSSSMWGTLARFCLPEAQTSNELFISQDARKQ